MKNRTIKLLLLGPGINKRNPEIASGPIVFFDGLIKELTNNNVDFIVIDTNKKNYANYVVAYSSIIFQLLFNQKKCTHISLHSSQDYMIFGILVILVGKIFKKRTSLRKFGGEAIRTYEDSSSLKKYYLNFIFTKMDTLFFQTKYLVTYFTKINSNTFWFPNVRRRYMKPSIPRIFHKKFVFISHVIREKGIDEIIEVIKKLDKHYIVDIYGPILDNKYTKEYFIKYNVSYKGALESDKVIEKLNQYDVVLLPSYKEGYPGIVIESYSLGMPVITTSLPAIKEIVDSYKTGILIEPGNVNQLFDAIVYFNENNYTDMSKNAYRKFEDFEFEQQTKKYLERI